MKNFFYVEWKRVRQQCRHVAQIHFLWVGDNTCQCFTNIGETCSIFLSYEIVVVRSYSVLKFSITATMWCFKKRLLSKKMLTDDFGVIVRTLAFFPFIISQARCSHVVNHRENCNFCWNNSRVCFWNLLSCKYLHNANIPLCIFKKKEFKNFIKAWLCHGSQIKFVWHQKHNP